MIIDIALGIVLAVILLYALGAAGAALCAIFEHLGTILFYALIALVGFAGIFVFGILVQALERQ